jgi:hypothetical protein
MPVCKTCGEFILSNNHYCSPRWKCYDVDNSDPEGACTVYATDARTAAAKYSKDKDDANCDHRNDRTVAVRLFGDCGAWTKYEVRVECVPEYYAREVEDKP